MEQIAEHRVSDDAEHRESIDFTNQEANAFQSEQVIELSDVAPSPRVRRSSRIANHSTVETQSQRNQDMNERRRRKPQKASSEDAADQEIERIINEELVQEIPNSDRNTRHKAKKDRGKARKDRKIRVVSESEETESEREVRRKKSKRRERRSRRKRSFSPSSSNPDDSDSDASQSSSSLSSPSSTSRNRRKRRTPRFHRLRKRFDDRKYGHRIMQVPEFNGNNWEIFRNRVKMVLSGLGLETYLEHPPSEHSKLELYNDRQAMNIICLKLHPNQYELTEECKHTIEVWTKLCDGFQPKPIAQRKDLFRQFLKLRKQPNQTMRQYLDNLSNSTWRSEPKAATSQTIATLRRPLTVSLMHTQTPLQ
jgi:hypothetical protein